MPPLRGSIQPNPPKSDFMQRSHESEEDRKRAQALHNKQSKHLLGVEISSYLSAFGLGVVGNGFLKKNETRKNIGWITTIGGLLGVIYNYHQGIKTEKELEKPENTNVILHGKHISPLENAIHERAENMGIINAPIQGKLISPDTVIVQSRKAWEEKMAEQKCSPDNDLSPSSR